MFMEMALIAAKRSTCFRLNVGAIVVVDCRAVSIGYNGPPSGEPHCQGNACTLPGKTSCHRADHAEFNALRRVPASVHDSDAELYVTHSPCASCCAHILDYGRIKRVVYQDEYRIADHLSVLQERGIEVVRLTPSDYMIDHFSKAILNDLQPVSSEFDVPNRTFDGEGYREIRYHDPRRGPRTT